MCEFSYFHASCFWDTVPSVFMIIHYILVPVTLNVFILKYAVLVQMCWLVLYFHDSCEVRVCVALCHRETLLVRASPSFYGALSRIWFGGPHHLSATNTKHTFIFLFFLIFCLLLLFFLCSRRICFFHRRRGEDCNLTLVWLIVHASKCS